MMHQAQMLFLVTGQCNMNCPHCAQGWWRKDHMDYHMTPDEIRTICRRTRELGMHFGQAMIMGGEPALWKHLEEGCRVIRESGVFDQIHIYTNYKKVDPLINLFDKGLADLAIVQTVNMSAVGVDKVWGKYASHVSIINQPTHWVHPDKPLDNMIPAGCGCDQITVFDGRVYSCPGAYHNTKRMGWDFDNPRLWVNVEDDWRTYFEGMDRYSIAACTVCLSNSRMSDRIIIGSRQGELK